MSIEIKDIDEKIKGLTAEREALQAQHAKMVQEHQEYTKRFQEMVAQSQVRFAQLTGAILGLEQLKQPKGEKNNDISIQPLLGSSNKRGKPDRNPDSVSGNGNSPGRNRRTVMGDRKVRQPNPATH